MIIAPIGPCFAAEVPVDARTYSQLNVSLAGSLPTRCRLFHSTLWSVTEKAENK